MRPAGHGLEAWQGRGRTEGPAQRQEARAAQGGSSAPQTLYLCGPPSPAPWPPRRRPHRFSLMSVQAPRGEICAQWTCAQVNGVASDWPSWRWLQRVGAAGVECVRARMKGPAPCWASVRGRAPHAPAPPPAGSQCVGLRAALGSVRALGATAQADIRSGPGMPSARRFHLAGDRGGPGSRAGGRVP